MELSVDVPEVSADSLDTEEELIGDFSVMVPLRKVGEDFQLTI